MEITQTGKRDFGSFHSSNVEELIQQDELTYIKPNLEITFDKSFYEKLKLGDSEQIKQILFHLTNEFCFLNHGAFGLTFKPTIEYVYRWQCFAESQPLRFYDRLIMPLLVDLIRIFSRKIFKCKPNELVLVENCTFAFNSVLNSMVLNKGDKIFIFSTCYGVYKKILKDLCHKFGAILIEEKVEFPIKGRADLLSKTVSKLDQIISNDTENRIKYIIVDHIPSNQPFIMPILELSSLAKSKRPDMIFIVDGAHSLGSVKDLNLSTSSIDIFFTNCHKWFCGPKGTAFMYRSERVGEKMQLKPAVRSHGINSGFNSEFIWLGLKDYAHYLGLYANLEIWFECFGGIDMVVDYCTDLAKKGAHLLKDTWSTEFLVDPSLCSTMICVKLPQIFLNSVLKDRDLEKLNYDEAELVQNYLYFEHSIEIPVKSIQNELYVRISAHIYNKIDDYRFLADVVVKNY